KPRNTLRGFLHSITGKNAHGATLIRKCALQGIRYEAAGRHWHSFGAHHSNLLGGVANCNEAGAGGDGTSDNRVLPFLDGEYWPWCHSCGEEEVAAITRVS